MRARTWMGKLLERLGLKAGRPRSTGKLGLAPVDPAKLEAIMVLRDTSRRRSPEHELGELLEEIANATHGDVLAVVSGIRHHYYSTGDKEGGDAMMQARRKAVKATRRAERDAILVRYEPYTRYPWLPSSWRE